MENERTGTTRRGLLTPCGALAIAMAVLIPLGMGPSRQAMGAAPGPVLPKMMDKSTVDAIDKGLNYLAKTQRPDGQWYPSGGYGSYPTAVTAIAGLALIAGGSTPESGPYAKNVRKAMFYFIRAAEADKDGLIATQSEGRSMHGHGFALLFLAQCYGMDLDEKTEKRLKNVLDRAVSVTQRSQSDNGPAVNHAGGWLYTPESGGDEGSVTVTQLQALRACRNVGIKVNKATIERAVAYLKCCQNADGGISYNYAGRGSGSRPPISAAAIACFYAAGVYDRESGGTGKEAEMVAKLIKFCQSHVNVEGGEVSGHYFYAHMYYAEAMYQRGGKDWETYYPKIRDKLINTQSPDGSWNGDSVGTTYGTGIACLILQLPYGYLPICQR
ncbi:MAG: prenyltransferase/squalene oxidase repeat-containing protein [Phycisphaerae bacterium]